MRVSPSHIEEAAHLIDPVFTHSPQFLAETLSERLGCRLLCKVETVNPIQSFKGRGADYYLARLASAPNRLVCASAGNFGQGLAFAARKRGWPLTVFAAETANPRKVAASPRLCAGVRLVGQDFDAAKEIGRTTAERAGWTFVEDGREPEIAEGAGTIALELCRWPEPLDSILVPLGNGALLAGIGQWMRTRSPQTRVIGVCAAGAPAMERSWRTSSLIVTETATTIADGIAVRVPVPEALQALRDVVDDIVLVEDSILLEAMRLVFKELGLLLEPAGAAGIAGVLLLRDQLRGQLVATPLCGGNIAPSLIPQVVSVA